MQNLYKTAFAEVILDNHLEMKAAKLVATGYSIVLCVEIAKPHHRIRFLFPLPDAAHKTREQRITKDNM